MEGLSANRVCRLIALHHTRSAACCQIDLLDQNIVIIDTIVLKAAPDQSTEVQVVSEVTLGGQLAILGAS